MLKQIINSESKQLASICISVCYPEPKQNKPFVWLLIFSCEAKSNQWEIQQCSTKGQKTKAIPVALIM